MTQFLVVNIAKKDIALCVIFSCDFLKIVVDILEYQAYNYIKDKGNNKFPISQINQLFLRPQARKGSTMTKNAMNKVIEGATSKSKAMVELYNAGCEIKEIAEAMQVRYNFVYNVVSNYCRMNEVELRTNKENGNSKKAMIAKLFKEGKSNTEIAKELKTNYNYVYKITKELIAQA